MFNLNPLSMFLHLSHTKLDIEIDACLDLAVKLKYVTLEDLKTFGVSIVKTFQMLSKMINRDQ